MAKEEFASASVTDTTAANIENDYVEDPFDDPFGDDAPEISRVKVELLELASATNRGFSATRRQRQSARELCERLNRFNPTREPLYPFYSSKDKLSIGGPSLVGKWTLIYTDVSSKYIVYVCDLFILLSCELMYYRHLILQA